MEITFRLVLILLIYLACFVIIAYVNGRLIHKAKTTFIWLSTSILVPAILFFVYYEFRLLGVPNDKFLKELQTQLLTFYSFFFYFIFVLLLQVFALIFLIMKKFSEH